MSAAGLMVLTADLALLGSFVAAGYLSVRAILPHHPRLLALGLGFPIGAGGYTWLLFLMSWAGMPIAPGPVAVLLAGWIGITFLAFRIRIAHAGHRREEGSAGGRERLPAICISALVGAGGLALLAAAIAVARSYSTWDSIAIWSVKGYGIALEGSVLAARDWGAHGLAYPLNIPLQVATYRLWDGDPLPGSKLIFAAYYASLILGAFAFWRWSAGRRTGASMGALFLAATPAVFIQGTDGYANLPFACYSVLGYLVAVQAVRASHGPSLFVAGLLLGMAAWTRPEGTFMSLAGSAVLVIALWKSRARRARYLSLLGPFLLMSGIWQFFSRWTAGAGLISGTLFEVASNGRGSLPWSDALYWVGRYTLREFASLERWGLAVPLAALLLLRHGRGLSSRSRPLARLVLSLGGVIGLGTAGFYGLLVFRQGNPDYWLGTTVDRMYLPAATLMIIGVITLALEKESDRGGTPRAEPVHPAGPGSAA